MEWLIFGFLASFVGGVMNTFSQQTANATNKDIAEQNLAFQKENLAYQKELQEKIFQREDTAYQRKMTDLKAAGLNPQLALGGGASSGSIVSTSAPQNGYQQQPVDYSSFFSNPLQFAETMRTIKSFLGDDPDVAAAKKQADLDSTNLANDSQRALNEHNAKMYKIQEEREQLDLDIAKEWNDPLKREEYVSKHLKNLLDQEYSGKERAAALEKTLQENAAIAQNRIFTASRIAFLDAKTLATQIETQLELKQITLKDLEIEWQRIKNAFDAQELDWNTYNHVSSAIKDVLSLFQQFKSNISRFSH